MSIFKKFLIVSVAFGLMNLAIQKIYMSIHKEFLNSSRSSFGKQPDVKKEPFMFSAPSQWIAIVPGELFIYSAYLDDRDSESPVVKVITASSGDTYRCLCRFWRVLPNTRESLLAVTDGRFIKLPDTGGRIRGYFISCYIQEASKKLITHVDIVTPTNITANARRIAVQRVQNQMPRQRNVTMCLSPLYGHISALDFVEYIEVNRLLGADHFIMYIMPSTVEHLIPLLHSYQAQGLLTLLHWDIARLAKRRNDVFYYAQTIALNDCLYRAMYSTQFMANTDLDEFIVPQKENSWLDMIQSIDNQENPGSSIGSYSFRNIFFSTAAHKDPYFQNRTQLKDKTIKTLDFAMHESKIFPHRARSKYICQPACVIMAGIHYVFNMVPQARTVVVDANTGFLNHYRRSPKRQSNQTNIRMHRFGTVLLQRMTSGLINETIF